MSAEPKTLEQVSQQIKEMQQSLDAIIERMDDLQVSLDSNDTKTTMLETKSYLEKVIEPNEQIIWAGFLKLADALDPSGKLRIEIEKLTQT